MALEFDKKPIPLQIPNGSEKSYYIAEEVSDFLGLEFKELVSEFPELKVRCLTETERTALLAINERESLQVAPVRMLEVKEVDDILQLFMTEEKPTVVGMKRELIATPPRGRMIKRKKRNDEEEIEDISMQVLAPIRLQIEQNGQYFSDVFTLNINQPCVAAIKFAEIICDENNLGPKFLKAIECEIDEQLEIFSDAYYYFQEMKNERMFVDINVTLHEQRFQKRIEWYIENDRETPEIYAERLCDEFELPIDFAKHIAFNIREQMLWHVLKTKVYKDELNSASA